MALADRLARGVKATFVAQLVYAVSNGLLLLLLTRYLFTQDEYGLLNFALGILGVLAVFAVLGITKSAARYITEYVEKDASKVPSILRLSFAYVTVLALVVGTALALGSGLLAELLRTPAAAPLLVAGVGYVGFKALNEYTRLAFQGFNRVELSAVMQVVSSVGRLVFTVGFVLAGLGPFGALLGYVAGFGIGALLGTWVLYWRFYRPYAAGDADAVPVPEDVGSGVDIDDDPEKSLSRRLLEYSVPLTATRGATVIDRRMDIVLVGTLLGMGPVGAYTLARQIADITVVPAASIGFTISPALGEQKAGRQLERAARLYEESLKYVFLLYIPGAVGLVLVAEPMVTQIFGAQWAEAAVIVQVFSIFTVVNAVNKVTTDGLDYLGLARERAIAKGITAVANLGLNLLLIPTVGAVGAAVATAITFSAYTMVNVYYMHTELSLRVGYLARLLGVVAGISVAMGAAVLFSVPYISGLPSLAAVIVLGAVVWAVLSVVSGLLDVNRIRSMFL